MSAPAGSYLGGLQQVKLRKTVTNDSSAPKLSGFISDSEVSKYQEDVLEANAEYWIHLLGDTTFHTEFYPLTKDDAQTFIDAYEHFEKKQEFPAELKERLQRIASGLQKVINSVKGNDTGVFVKTSSRSAKDTGIFHSKFKDLYKDCLRKRGDKDDNDKIIALLDAGTLVLKMETAEQVLEMFSISERISQDMKLALQHPESFDDIEHFVVRKWVDLDPSMEFRGFVCKDKLNALSQYNHLAYFPHLVNESDEIVKAITDFYYNVVQPKLKGKFTKYVIDFAITPATEKGEKYKLWVIELNPFLPTTDGALFSWEKERSILENGPFEYRHRTSKSLGAKAMLANSWREIVDTVKL